MKQDGTSEPIDNEVFDQIIKPIDTIVSDHTVPYLYPNKVTTGYKYHIDAASSAEDTKYVAPKYRAGSVVTYLEDGRFKMGKIKSAIFLEKTWRYRVMDAYSDVYESMIREVIHMDNQQFIKDL